MDRGAPGSNVVLHRMLGSRNFIEFWQQQVRKLKERGGCRRSNGGDNIGLLGDQGLGLAQTARSKKPRKLLPKIRQWTPVTENVQWYVVPFNLTVSSLSPNEKIREPFCYIMR